MNFNFSNKNVAISIVALCRIPVLYLVLIAQDRYQTSSHFSVVVEESNNVDASMGLLDFVGGASGVASDTQIAIGFINSADLLFELEGEFNL